MLEAVVAHHEVSALGVDHGGLGVETDFAPLEVVLMTVLGLESEFYFILIVDQHGGQHFE